MCQLPDPLVNKHCSPDVLLLPDGFSSVFILLLAVSLWGEQREFAEPFPALRNRPGNRAWEGVPRDKKLPHVHRRVGRSDSDRKWQDVILGPFLASCLVLAFSDAHVALKAWFKFGRLGSGSLCQGAPGSC
jgi:hypothetical protein